MGPTWVGLERYYVRWRTDSSYGRLEIVGWDLMDRFKTLQTFAHDEKDQAEALCKLLNSIEYE